MSNGIVFALVAMFFWGVEEKVPFWEGIGFVFIGVIILSTVLNL